MAECKGCGADIIWIKMAGKNIPLDARKHPIYWKMGEVWEKIDARISHFVTCPKAGEFSASKKKTHAGIHRQRNKDHE